MSSFQMCVVTRYTTKKIEFKCLSLLDMRVTKCRVQIVEALPQNGAELLSLRCKMQEGHFYFINERLRSHNNGIRTVFFGAFSLSGLIFPAGSVRI